jgi:hypothetical protein
MEQFTILELFTFLGIGFLKFLGFAVLLLPFARGILMGVDDIENHDKWFVRVYFYWYPLVGFISVIVSIFIALLIVLGKP